MPTNLTAVAEGRWLTIAGTAAAASPNVIVAIVDEENIEVYDNDPDVTGVSIQGNPKKVVNVDAGDILNSGILFTDYYVGSDNRVIASQYADWIFAGDGSDSVRGKDGGDTLMGGYDGDTLLGDEGDDSIEGDNGDDILSGGEGSDIIRAGDDFDTAEFSGALADYVVEIRDGSFFVTGLGDRLSDGTDRLIDVERAQFADQILALGVPTNVTAMWSANVLLLSGETASYGISLGVGEEDVDVTDRSDNPVEVPVTGEPPVPGTEIVVDVSQISGEGVFVSSYTDSKLVIHGSDQSDLFSLTGRGRMNCAGGDDQALGGFGRDSLYGQTGDDSLRGNEGDDRLDGGNGDDQIDGGEGVDVAMFNGSSADYLVELQSSYYTITALSGGQSPDVDTLIAIELLRFDDGDVALPPATRIVAQSRGETLVLTGESAQAYLVDVDYDFDNRLNVEDNGRYPVMVPLPDEGLLRHLDADQLAVGGIRYNAYGYSGTGGHHVRATQQDDAVTGGNEADTLIGLGGDDYLDGEGGDDQAKGGGGNDELRGGEGMDSLFGGSGDDELEGGLLDDIIKGDGGTDTALFEGYRANYDISFDNGVYYVTGKQSYVGDGTDAITGVERLEFADQVVILDGLGGISVSGQILQPWEALQFGV